ncbi:hypothetical protein ACHQM5_023311 [Ranunculus cassubicifolius]
MGNCTSYGSASTSAAKLILQNGEMEEFSYPVRVSYLLQKYPSCFICDSDSLEYDDFVSAINGDEELQPGHLYFALPLSKSKYPLQAEEMAAMAVKASMAFINCGNNGKQASSVNDKRDRRRLSGDGCSVGGGMRKKSKLHYKDNRRNFTSTLAVIQE